MSERIAIQDNQVKLSNGQAGGATTTVGEFTKRILHSSVQGLHDEPISYGVRWNVVSDSWRLVVVEFQPQLRCIHWPAHEKPASSEDVAIVQRQLATPYTVVKIPFRRDRVLSRVEVFYRNQELGNWEGEGGELFWPNLLNVSPHAYGCTSWFCTQYLRAEAIPRGVAAGIDAVAHHLWGGQFNYSSEINEGKSTFGKAVEDGLDQRVTDVDRWEASSRENPRFVLSIDWKSTGLTIRDVMMREMAAANVKPVPDTAAALGNLVLLHNRKPK